MSHIIFKTDVGKEKPNYFVKESQCPFCDDNILRKENRVIAETSEFLIIENKYPVFKDAYQTVLIENIRDCDNKTITNYSLDYLTRLFRFGINQYRSLLKTGYRSGVYFKNEGLASGGSVKHPHQQIIMFKDIDCNEQIRKEDFEGETILSNEIIDWNISNSPKSEFYEFNLTLKKEERLEVLMECLQKTVQFVKNELMGGVECYNLVILPDEDTIRIKVVPRKAASILLLGYGLHQVPDNLKEIAEQLRNY